MGVADYSTTPASNASVGGADVSENCDPGGVNNAIRQIMADVAGYGSDTTFSIPTDYATLQEAIDAQFIRPRKQGVRIILNIESGHTLTANASGNLLLLKHGDYSHFRITSVDAEVLIDTTVTGDVIKCEQNAVMPVLATLINANGNGTIGVHLDLNSSGSVATSCGVKNAGGHGLRVGRGSSLSATGSVFSGAGQTDINASGAFITAGSHVDLSLSDISGAALDGIVARRGSIANGHTANVSSAGRYGFNASRAYLIAESGNAASCGTHALSAERGGIISADQATATLAGTRALNVSAGGIIIARDVTTDSGTPALSDTNVWAFNVTTENGIIWDSNAQVPAQSHARTYTIAAEAADSLDVNKGALSYGTMFIATSGAPASGRPHGMFSFRVGTSPYCSLIAPTSITNVATTTGALTGTTGTAGNFTISTHTDGKIYFENRTGSSQTIKVRVTF